MHKIIPVKKAAHKNVNGQQTRSKDKTGQSEKINSSSILIARNANPKTKQKHVTKNSDIGQKKQFRTKYQNPKFCRLASDLKTKNKNVARGSKNDKWNNPFLVGNIVENHAPGTSSDNAVTGSNHTSVANNTRSKTRYHAETKFDKTSANKNSLHASVVDKAQKQSGNKKLSKPGTGRQLDTKKCKIFPVIKAIRHHKNEPTNTNEHRRQTRSSVKIDHSEILNCPPNSIPKDNSSIKQRHVPKKSKIVQDKHNGTKFKCVKSCRLVSGLRIKSQRAPKELTNRWTCAICNNQQFRTRAEQRLHRRKFHPKFVCNLCSDGFMRQKALKNHKEKIHHESPDVLEKVREHCCESCGKKFF